MRRSAPLETDFMRNKREGARRARAEARAAAEAAAAQARDGPAAAALAGPSGPGSARPRRALAAPGPPGRPRPANESRPGRRPADRIAATSLPARARVGCPG